MYQVIDGCSSDKPALYPGVFLFGEEGIPLQENRVVNRFVNFPNDQLLIWLMHHQNGNLEKIDGVTLPLYGDWSDNFWHWCFENLPVALRAHQGGFSGTYLVPDVPFAAESLQLLGIRPDRIRRAEGSDYFLECMCLVGKRHGSHAENLEALSKIRALWHAEFREEGRDERLYISRNGNPDSPRKLVNEADLLQLLEPYGFTVLHMEKLTLADQLRYSCNASALITPHGAAMAHSAFLPEGALVLELFAPSYINPCVIPTCRQLRHRYHQVTSFTPHTGYKFGLDVEAYLQIIEMNLSRAFA